MKTPDYSKAKSIVIEKAAQAKKMLDEKGVTEKAEQISTALNEHFDTVSGKKLLALVEERLDLQEKYNDILATKLNEALERIAALEKERLSKVK